MILDKRIFCVFDLDDTLYQEWQYHESGLDAVSALISKLYGEDTREQLRDWNAEGEVDLFGLLCARLKLPSSVKESLLWCYRLHSPTIELDRKLAYTLRRVASETAGLAILTDGRAVSQRQKLASLGLLRFPVLISEECISPKPSSLRFRMIEDRFERSAYVYIADNPKKDFITPNEIGWYTIGISSTGRNIHSQSMGGLTPMHAPQEWISSIEALAKCLPSETNPDAPVVKKIRS